MVEPEADKTNTTWSIWREPNWRDPGIKIIWWWYLLGLVRVFVVFFLCGYVPVAAVVSLKWLFEPALRTEYDGYIDFIVWVMTGPVVLALCTFAGTFFVLIAIGSDIWSRTVGWRRKDPD